MKESSKPHREKQESRGFTKDFRSADKTLQLSRFTVDNIADAVYWMNPDAQIVDVNEAACRMLDYTREEFLSLTVFDIDPDLTADKWANAWEAVKSRGKITLETVHRTKDGRIIPVEIMANYLCFDGEELDCAFARDITKRKRQEQALVESEANYRNLFDSSTDGIFILDLDGNFIDANRTAYERLGYAREELLSLNIRTLDDPSFARRVPKRFKQIQEHGVAVFESAHLRKDGSTMPVEVNSRLLEYKGRQVYFSVIRDITDRKRAEELLRHSHAELEDKVKERTKELAASQEQLRSLFKHLQSLREEERTSIAREIHDDLGQSLTALKMDLARLAAQACGDDEMLRERLNADVDHVDKIIQSVKRVCTELRPTILDHLGLAAAVEWQCEEFQKRTGIKCDTLFDPEDVDVDSDLGTALFRVFQEAFTNVVKHAKATEAKTSIKRTSSSIVLEITDNGVGITEEELSKSGSFGLLGIRERVYPWGGIVTVSGARNKGTTVKITIPLRREPRS